MSINLTNLPLFPILLTIFSLLISCSPTTSLPTATNNTQNPQPTTQTEPTTSPLSRSDEEWRQILTPEQFHILREEGTERAFSGKYNAHYENGNYHCAACGHPLFSSETKFDSRTGWPSFYQPLEPQSIGSKSDNSLAQQRTEVHCANCGGHLGHVFPDGPKPTGLRYCLNSIALSFEPAQ